MRSIKEICVIGSGPSSSHTMGPSNACKYIIEKYKNIDEIIIVLYGSLAKTGRGHLTDYIINKRLSEYKHKIFFNTKKNFPHPNTMEIYTITNPYCLHKDKFVSIGGGSLIINDDNNSLPVEIYPEHNMNEILSYCEKHSFSLLDYVNKYDKDAKEYFTNIVSFMKGVVERGLTCKDEVMPGDYRITRKAPKLYQNYLSLKDDDPSKTLETYLSIAAMAASEENACGHEVVCSPTCGSSGILPGIVSFLLKKGYSEDKIVDAMMVGSLIGIVCKQNGSISGAEAGCQAEIGVASAIGAAMFAHIDGLSNNQITLAAEMIIEHSLGLTCDAIEGRVQIPCVNRNALYAFKAYDAYRMIKIMGDIEGRVSLDDAIEVMAQTGKDIDSGYRETAEKGLAELFREKKEKIGAEDEK